MTKDKKKPKTLIQRWAEEKNPVGIIRSQKSTKKKKK